MQFKYQTVEVAEMAEFESHNNTLVFKRWSSMIMLNNTPKKKRMEDISQYLIFSKSNNLTLQSQHHI